jgi:hypothetical protein
MKNIKLTLAAFAALTMCVIPVSSAHGGDVLIDFDTYPDTSPVPSGPTVSNQWASLGVVFTNAFAVPNLACSLSVPNHVAQSFSTNPVIALFLDPATGGPGVTDFAGTAQDLCWAPGEGIDMRAYDINGNLIGHIFNSGAGNFEAFSFPEPVIARIEMYSIGQGIDNFRFNTPVALQPRLSIRCSEVELCWNSVSNATYRVEYRSDLTTNTWVSLRDCLLSSGTTTCITDKILLGQPQRFYQVVVTNCVPSP